MYSRQCLIDAKTVDAKRVAASADADVASATGVDMAALLFESAFFALRRIEPEAVDGVDGRDKLASVWLDVLKDSVSRAETLAREIPPTSTSPMNFAVTANDMRTKSNEADEKVAKRAGMQRLE